MIILDFDLDFVVRPIRRGGADRDGRYEGPDITVWKEQDFRLFLGRNLLLSESDPLFGNSCEHHKEVFSHVERLIDERVLVPPFHWIHVDAHDDIFGCSDAAPINSANFILHLIGRDWLAQLDFVLPEGEACPPECLVKRNPLRIEFDSHRCPINYHDDATYQMPRRPDFVFLTRSPDFTPVSADALFEIGRNHIKG